jgi:membrane protease YdiL (CAAX protease family)
VINERRDARPVLHGFVFVLIVALVWSIPAASSWPVLWIAPLAAYLLIVAFVPLLRRSFRLWRFGKVTSKSVVAAVVLAVLSCGVLVAFHYFLKPDLSRYAGRLPIDAMGGVVLAGFVFAVVNAAFEEIFFRGILFGAIEPDWGNTAAVLITAVAFGYGHMEGYPPGIVGAILAVVYGLALGILRAYTGGIGLCFLAHAVADGTIYTLLARSNAW